MFEQRNEMLRLRLGCWILRGKAGKHVRDGYEVNNVWNTVPTQICSCQKINYVVKWHHIISYNTLIKQDIGIFHDDININLIKNNEIASELINN